MSQPQPEGTPLAGSSSAPLYDTPGDGPSRTSRIERRPLIGLREIVAGRGIWGKFSGWIVESPFVTTRAQNFHWSRPRSGEGMQLTARAVGGKESWHGAPRRVGHYNSFET